MSVVLEAGAVRAAPAIPMTDERPDVADVVEELIAAHRAALLELAPHQAWCSVREDTGWHMAELGLLLCWRDTQGQMQMQSAAGGTGGHRRQEESAGPDRQTR